MTNMLIAEAAIMFYFRVRYFHVPLQALADGGRIPAVVPQRHRGGGLVN